MTNQWHLESPDQMFGEETCRDLAAAHATATGHLTTEVFDDPEDQHRLTLISCDSCDWLVPTL